MYIDHIYSTYTLPLISIDMMAYKRNKISKIPWYFMGAQTLVFCWMMPSWRWVSRIRSPQRYLLRMAWEYNFYVLNWLVQDVGFGEWWMFFLSNLMVRVYEVLDIQKPQRIHRVLVKISTEHRVSCIGHHGTSSKRLDDLKARIRKGSLIYVQNSLVIFTQMIPYGSCW